MSLVFREEGGEAASQNSGCGEEGREVSLPLKSDPNHGAGRCPLQRAAAVALCSALALGDWQHFPSVKIRENNRAQQ